MTISVLVFDLILALIFIPYSIWNWKLAVNGVTQVEHAKNLFRFRDRTGSITEKLCNFFQNHKKILQIN
jgi:hypothetical protein